MKPFVHLLLVCISIASILTAECAFNQADGQSSSQPKLRYRRASGGIIEDPDLTTGTFWMDSVRKEDAILADKKFYGSGIVVGPQHILAQRRPVRDIILSPEKVGVTRFWNKPIQFVVEEVDNYKIHNINGVDTYYGRYSRHFSLKDVGSPTPSFVLLRREKNTGHGIQYVGNIPVKFKYPDLDTYCEFPKFATDKTDHGDNCVFHGWSQHPQDNSYSDNIRQYVRFPVEIKEGSCNNNFCTFYKSDGLPGGFCNTFQDAGGQIKCGKDGKKLYYITVYNGIHGSSKTCNGTIDAYFLPLFREELERLLKLDIAAMKQAKRRVNEHQSIESDMLF